jgi:hypothetical protein
LRVGCRVQSKKRSQFIAGRASWYICADRQADVGVRRGSGEPPHAISGSSKSTGRLSPPGVLFSISVVCRNPGRGFRAGTPEGDSGALYPLQQGVPSIVRADARFIHCSLVCTYNLTSHGRRTLSGHAAACSEIEGKQLPRRLYFVIFARSVTRTSIGTAGFMTEK